MSRYRTIIALLAAMTIIHGASSLMFVTAPLALAVRGVGAAGVGLTAALFGLGYIVGALFAPRVIKDLGHIRAFALFAALAAALTLMLGGFNGAVGWAVLRFVAGVSVAGAFAVGESWIAQTGPSDRRGDLLSVYAMVTRVGVMGAPFLIAGMSPGGAGALMTAGALFALALTPIAATRQSPPTPPAAERMDPMKLARMAPAAFAGAFVAGFVNGSVLQLGPIYATAGQETASAGAAAAFNAAIVLGGLLAQWPAGRASDFRDRRGVIGALSGFAALMALLLALTPLGAPGAVTQMFALLWGGGALSIYAICVAHGADRVPQGQIARLVSGMMVVWAAGAASGPLITGVFMASPLGPSALFWVAGLAQAGLALLMFRRRAAREPAQPDDKEAFTPVLASSGALSAMAAHGDDVAEDGGLAGSAGHDPHDGDVWDDDPWDEGPEPDVDDVAADIASPPPAAVPGPGDLTADQDVGAGAASAPSEPAADVTVDEAEGDQPDPFEVRPAAADAPEEPDTDDPSDDDDEDDRRPI